MKQIGTKIVRLHSVESTNNYAANVIKTGNWLSGTVILADEQTGGRGQRGNSWYSEAGMNLTASILLKQDNLSVNASFDLSKYVAVVLIDVLSKYGIQGQIKWPNDILVNEQKIAGVLIENQLKQTLVDSSIIGIGLNVNQQEFEGLNATSIRVFNGNFTPVLDVVMTFIQAFNARINESAEKLHKEYLSNLWGYQQVVEYTVVASNTEMKGIIQGIDPQGFLEIEENGTIKKYDLKEVQFKLRNTF